MKRIVASLCLAACGPLESMEADGAASTSQAIVNGNFRSDVTFGGALVETATSTCSGAFLAEDLVLTHIRCKAATRVWVGGKKYSIKLARNVPFNNDLAALQLRQEVPSIATLRPTNRRVSSGEQLSCFGFDAQRTFTSGEFRVTDLSGDFIFLAGGLGFSGTFGVDTTDDGGFCIRDGGELAAIFSLKGTASPRAVQVDQASGWLANLMNAVVQARSRASLTLVNDPNLATPTTLTASGTALTSSPRVAKSLPQAFYLAPAVPARPEVVSLVNADSGRCVSASGLFLPTANLATCAMSTSRQQFVLVSSSNVFPAGMTDGYKLESLGAPGWCLVPTGAPFLVPCTSSQASFGFWLNLF